MNTGCLIKPKGKNIRAGPPFQETETSSGKKEKFVPQVSKPQQERVTGIRDPNIPSALLCLSFLHEGFISSCWKLASSMSMGHSQWKLPDLFSQLCLTRPLPPPRPTTKIKRLSAPSSSAEGL